MEGGLTFQWEGGFVSQMSGASFLSGEMSGGASTLMGGFQKKINLN